MYWMGLVGLMRPIQYIPPGQDRRFEVLGRSRVARVVSPSRLTERPPVIFSFVGAGGQAYYAVDEYALHIWSEAVVYYAQPSGSQTTTASWRASDVAFFEAMRRDALSRFHADPARMYVHGYSSGASFAADLWQYRGDQIAKFALVSGGRYSRGFKPHPVLLCFGTQEPNAAALKHLASRLQRAIPKTKVITHSGGHAYPKAMSELIIDFFRRGE